MVGLLNCVVCEDVVNYCDSYYYQKIKDLKLFDDDFMVIVFEDWSCLELLIKIIFDLTEVELTNVEIQTPVTNLQGRSLRMDILVEVERLGTINIEVQRSPYGAPPERLRLHSSLLDTRISDKGMSFDDLSDGYVIFIMENDVFEKGFPVYHIERMIEETGRYFKDRSHLMYINGANTEDTKLGRLMHDFHCIDPDEMYYEELASRVRYLKRERKGIERMCVIWDEIREKGRQEGREEGRQEGRQEGREEERIRVIKNLMKSLNIGIKEAMELLEIPESSRDLLMKMI